MALHHRVLPPDHQGHRAEPRARPGVEPLLPEHPRAPLDPRRRSPAARRRSARSASAAATSTSRWRSTPAPAAPAPPAPPRRRSPGVLRRDRGRGRRRGARGRRDARRSCAPSPAWPRASQSASTPSREVRLLLVADDAADARPSWSRRRSRIERAPDRDVETPDGVYYACSAPAQRVGGDLPGAGLAAALHGQRARARLPRGAGRVGHGRTMGPRDPEHTLGEVVMPRPVFGERTSAHEARLTATEWAQPPSPPPAWRRGGALAPRPPRRRDRGAQLRRGHGAPRRRRPRRERPPPRRPRARARHERGRGRDVRRDGGRGLLARPPRAALERFGLDVRVANHNAPSSS